MSPLKATLLRAVLLVSIGLIALALICTITVLGLMSLLSALTAAAAVYIGSTGATFLIGALCLSPVLVAIMIIIRLYRNVKKAINQHADDNDTENSANNALSSLIKGNPWEAASLAFLLGFTYNSDPKLRALIMHEGLDKLKTTSASSSENNKNE